jgi:Na+/melibiose symporter-like transporter
MIFFFVAIGIMTAFMESLKDKFDPKTLLVVFVPMMLIIGYVYLARWGKKQGEQEADGIREIMRELFKDVLSNK